MAQYVYVTIATKIVVKKTGHYYFGGMEYTMEQIREKLENTFNLSLYNIYENSEYVGFVMKPEIIKQYLYDFLYEQSFHLLCGDEIRNELENIRDLDEEMIVYMLRNNQLKYIHYIDFDVMKSDYIAYDLEIYLEGVNYLSDGKIKMELYAELFQYINQMIRKSSTNPLKDAVYIMIVG
ncbi:hypothetical protein [Candidatus Stoquefichus sp. SB1]|uniref:hypothetical protein n=1 Tax=Candidatus Stoquefichus sp. SB1 TaxID=1658109 RepID=UPI00067E79C2|nr:hypothetical protein [Candidatus Stoquefichus sp. SB1]